MLARALLLSCLGLLAACGPSDEVFVGELSAPVVYGDDDRREVFNHPSEDLRRIAQESIVALIPSSRIDRSDDNGIYELFTTSLKNELMVRDELVLCDDEPFANQPVAASCSGVLISDDLVLTAGHCINEWRPCDSFQYVFNYYLDSPSQLAFIRDEDVYSCARVVLESDAPSNALTPDFAIIELDRPVVGGHSPAAIRPAVALTKGDPISMIGFGSGLPAKIDSGAFIANARADVGDYFVANLDAFGGHSGSATFDAENRLAGILLGGRVPDYAPSPGEDCARANVFADSEAGEIVHNVAPIVSALCAEGIGGDALCEPDACDGSPCGVPSVPGPGGGGAGAVAADSSGCSAVAGVPEAIAGYAMLLLVLAMLRFRRTAV
jgi:hypothetical protein